MPELLSWARLADLGQASVPTVWIPVAAWTLVALAAEIGLRASRAPASVSVRVRSLLLLSLPLAALVPAALSQVPSAAGLVASMRPGVLLLPEVVVGAAPEAPTEAPVAIGWVLAGLATLAAVSAGVVALARWGLSLARLGRVENALAPAADSVQSTLDAARRDLDVRVPVEARHSAPGVAPFTFGWRRPVVALPPSLEGEPLRLAIAHELAHVRHRDFAWNVAERGVAALAVVHPLVRLLGREIAQGREQAADAAVLADCPERRRSYADLLLSFASLPAPGLTLSAAQGSSFLHSRIHAMSRLASPSDVRRQVALGRRLALLTACVLLGAAVAIATPSGDARASAASESGDVAQRLEGRVVDAADGSGIAGASVQVLGQELGAATDETGAFTLSAPNTAFAIRTTAAGYRPAMTRIEAGQSDVRIELRALDVAVETSPGSGVYEIVEQPPTLVGGLEGLQGRVVYPEQARAEGVEGRVFVTFVVDREGGVEDLSVARSPSPLLSEAALEAVRASRFEPGLQRGEAVKARYSLPINFRLPGTDSDAAPARPEAPAPEIFQVVEEAPVLIGGLRGLQERVVYPPEARAEGIEGRVFVTFVVNEQGKTQNLTVERSPDPRLSEAALEAVRNSRFTPARQRGEAVKVRYALPINFALPADGSDDRGSLHSDEALAADRVYYAGVDLSLLENESQIRALLASAAASLEATGSATVRYLLQPDGTTSDFEVEGGGPVAQAALSVASAMILSADRRPLSPREGFFRLEHLPR